MEKELQAFQVLDFEPVSEYARKLFREYRDLRAKVSGWYAAGGKPKAWNQGTKWSTEIPGPRRLGGELRGRDRSRTRASWSRCGATVRVLRRLDGTIVEDAHLEDMVVVLKESTNIERAPLNFEDDEGDPDREDYRRRSPGQMLSETASPPETVETRPRGKGSKLDKVSCI